MKFAHRPKHALAAIFTVGLAISGPSGKLALLSCLCVLLCSWASEPGVSRTSINDISTGEERRLSPFSPSPHDVRTPRIKSKQFLRDPGHLTDTDEIPLRKSRSLPRGIEDSPKRAQSSRDTKFDFRSVDAAPEQSHLQSQIGLVTESWLKEREIGSQDVARLDDLQLEIDALIDRWTKTASVSPSKEFAADVRSKPRSVRSKNSTLIVPDTPSKYLESVHSSGEMSDAADIDQNAQMSTVYLTEDAGLKARTATPPSNDDFPLPEHSLSQSVKATDVTGKVEESIATERLQSEFLDSEELMSKSRRSLKQLSNILESRGLREQWVDPSPSCLFGALVQQFNDMPLLRAQLEQRGYDFSSELSCIDNITTARFLYATKRCREDVMSFLSDGKNLDWMTSLDANNRHHYLEDTQPASAWPGLREVMAASRLFCVEIHLFIISEDQVIEREYKPSDQNSKRSNPNETIRLINCGSFFWSAIPYPTAQRSDYPSSHDKTVHSNPPILFAKEPSSERNTMQSEQSCIDSYTFSSGCRREMRGSTPADSRSKRLRDARIPDQQHQGDDYIKDAPLNITDLPFPRNSAIEEKFENTISYIDYRAAPMQFTNVSSRVFRTALNYSTNVSGERFPFLRKGARQMKRATFETAGLTMQENLDHDAVRHNNNTGLNIGESPRAGFLFRDQQANHSVLQYNAKLKDIPSIVSKYWTAPAEAFNLTAGNGMMRTNRDDPNKVQGRGMFRDHRALRDSWSSGAEWAGSDDFEDSSEFRTRRTREYSTDFLGSELEQRLMEDFFQETIKLATPKAPPRSIGKSSRLFRSSSRGQYSTPPPPPSPSWAQTSVWHTRSDVRQKENSGRSTGLGSNDIPHLARARGLSHTSSFEMSMSTALGDVDAKGLNMSAELGAKLAKKSSSPQSHHMHSRMAVRDSESRPAEVHGVLENTMKDLLQFVKQSEVRNAESLKLLHDRNSELTEKMVDILNQTGRAQAKALIDERIANLERELQAKIKEANAQQSRAREMHRMKENESEGGLTAQPDIRDGLPVPNAVIQTKSAATLEMEAQAHVKDANEQQRRLGDVGRMRKNESHSEDMAQQYRGFSSVSGAATQINFSANLERELPADINEGELRSRLNEMHPMMENGAQNRVVAQQGTQDGFTGEAATQIKISAERIAKLERELQAKVKEADEQQNRLREMQRMKEFALKSGVTVQQYRGSSSLSDPASQSKNSADRISGVMEQHHTEGPLNFNPATQSRISDEQVFNVESQLPGSATSGKRQESTAGYQTQDPVRISETKAALQRRLESKLEAQLENQLLESERSDSSYDRPEDPSRNARGYRQPAQSHWKEDGPRGLNVHFPNSLWQNDYMGETKSIYFREQCAAWDRRLTAEISAAIPTFEQASFDYRHEGKTRRKEFDYSMPSAPWDENFDFRNGEIFRHEDQNSRRQQLFGRQGYYSENEGRFDGNNLQGANLEVRSDASYPFPPAVSHESDPRFQPEFRTAFDDDLKDGSSQSLKQRAEQVGQDIEEARQRVERAREALAIVVEDAARKGEHAERLKAALDEIREIREKRSEVEKRVLELQAEEEEHIQELNGQKDGGASRLDKRRAGRNGTARQTLASGGGIQSNEFRSTTTNGEGAALIDDNRSAVLDSLREKLTEAENFNRQLENRLRRAEEILEAARSQPFLSANATDQAPASSSSAQENPAQAPSGVVAPTAVIGPASAPFLPDPASVSGKAWTGPQLADRAKQAPWSLPVHVLEREPLELRPPLPDSEWQRRADDQVLANRLAALVPLDDASASRQPRVPADAQAWASYPPASPPVTFDRYNYPQGSWGPPTRTGRAEPLARRSPPPLDQRGGGNAVRARWDYSPDEWGRRQPQSGPAARRSMGRRSDRRGRDGDFDQSDGYEEEERSRQERREPSRNSRSRRAPSRREGGGGRRESADRAPERRTREERRAPEGRRRGEGEGRRGNDAETDAGEVERLLASVGLSGYEAVLLRNGWDCMARLRLIKEADLVGMGVKPGHARIMAESIGRALSAA